MPCLICAAIMLSRSRQTIEGENGALVITSWRCQSCNQIYEEIWSSKGYQGVQSQRLLYRVRSVEKPARTALTRQRRTRRIHAHAVMG
jgi:hypothetical protein